MTSDVLLFDLDGTLSDPRPGVVGCIRFALNQLAVPCPADDVLVTYIGPPLRNTFRILLGTSEVDRIEEAIGLYRQQFADSGLYENRVYDGVPEMLEHVRESMYVATSKPTVYADSILKHLRLDHHFRRVYGPELDGRYDDKADLLTYLLAAERIAPEAAVMIGDRAEDIEAAKANGMRSVGVLWGYGSEKELTDAGADALCSTPGTLTERLSRWHSR